jgi:hypothetical protein
MIAGRHDTTENVAHFRFVVDETQQGLPDCALLADPEYIFGGRIQADDQQMLIQQYNPGTQGIEDVAGIAAQGSVIVGAAAPGSIVVRRV